MAASSVMARAIPISTDRLSKALRRHIARTPIRQALGAQHFDQRLVVPETSRGSHVARPRLLDARHRLWLEVLFLMRAIGHLGRWVHHVRRAAECRLLLRDPRVVEAADVGEHIVPGGELHDLGQERVIRIDAEEARDHRGMRLGILEHQLIGEDEHVRQVAAVHELGVEDEAARSKDAAAREEVIRLVGIRVDG
eukprot:scaffold49043_cov69-Phaeocystis_antarctica.AAC.6